MQGEQTLRVEVLGKDGTMLTMLTWAEFVAAAPPLAAFGESRFVNRVAYLATVRADGGPRVHPVTPIAAGGHLYVYMEPTSPKGHDLRRDPRFALHCSVEDSDGGGGEFVIHGTASQIMGTETRVLYDSMASYTPKARYILFELRIERATATRYVDGMPVREKWPG